MSWMRSGTEMSLFVRMFLPSFGPAVREIGARGVVWMIFVLNILSLHLSTSLGDGLV